MIAAFIHSAGETSTFAAHRTVMTAKCYWKVERIGKMTIPKVCSRLFHGASREFYGSF